MNSSTESKCVMWGVAADTRLSCWMMGQCTPVAAMTWVSWDTRSPERNQVGCICLGLVTGTSCGHVNIVVPLVLPEQVVALDAQIIVAVSCGESHTLALNDKGQVFSWGLGSDGQLGLNNFEECIRVPR